MKCEIPGCEPRELPFIWHRQNTLRIQVTPVDVTDMVMGLWRWPEGIIPVQPQIDIIQIYLLVPEHTGERLALDLTFVFARVRRVN